MEEVSVSGSLQSDITIAEIVVKIFEETLQMMGTGEFALLYFFPLRPRKGAIIGKFPPKFRFNCTLQAIRVHPDSFGSALSHT